MEADGAAARLRIIIDAMEEVRRRSLRERGWTIKQATEDMRSGEWERRRRLYRTLQANAVLAEVDPWDLPPRFFMAKELGSSSLRTHSGYWKEKKDEFIAIRKEGGEGSSSASSSPSYQGVRMTLKFYKHNGTKTDWVMQEYNMLNDDMFVQEDVVFRKVFNKKHTDRIPPYFVDVGIALEVYHECLAKHAGTFHPSIIRRHYMRDDVPS